MKMRANFRRRLTLLMAGCLVLGSIQMTGFPVQASQIVGGILSEGGEAVPASVSGGDSVSAGDPAFTVGDNSGPEEENNGLEADVFSGEPQTTNAETGEIYAAEDLNAYERWSKTPVELTDGKRVFTFTKQYEEYCLDLPKSLDMADCESIIVRTADQNGSLCLKVYGSDMSKELKPYYGNSGKNEYTFIPDFTGKAVCIGIMSDSASDTYPFTAQIVSISFVMKNVQDEDTSGKKVYSGETLKAYGRWNNTPVELTDGKLILSYNAQWDEYCLDLPEALDMAVCENITIL